MRTTNRRWDVSGLECTRVMRVVLLWKMLALDDVAGKPPLRDLAALAVRHYLGGMFAVVTVKYERQWLEFLRGFRRRRSIVARRAGLVRDKLLGRLDKDRG